MDAFEELICKYLRSENYWSYSNIFVELSKEDKEELGTPTRPRIEIDVCAYSASNNELLVLEAKSWLDSAGVRYVDVIGKGPHAKEFKLLNRPKFRRILLRNLKKQLIERGLINKDTHIKIGLFVGKFGTRDSEELLREYFTKRDWLLITPKQLTNWLVGLSGSKYQNDPTVLAVKLLTRNQ